MFPKYFSQGHLHFAAACYCPLHLRQYRLLGCDVTCGHDRVQRHCSGKRTDSLSQSLKSKRKLCPLQFMYPCCCDTDDFFFSDICRPNDGQSSIFDAPPGGCVCPGESELSHHDLQPLVFRWRQAGTLSRLPLTRLRQKLSTSTITSFSGQSKMIACPVGRKLMATFS